MSWSVSASGHTDNPEDEKTLAAAIGIVLANAGPAVGYASFAVDGLAGDPRDLATPVQGTS